LAARGAFAALVIAAAALAWLDPHALAAVPALMLPALFMLRRYPGERTVCALARRARRSLPRPHARATPRARVAQVLPRGGRLLGSSLAVRPPPGLARAAS
jgi:hypothetical protein